MIVLLMRHADREPTTNPRNERDLPLTLRGIQEVTSVSRQLAEKLAGYPPVKYVLTSPHCAAIETARHIIEALAIPCEAALEDLLDPDAHNPRDPRGISTLIDSLAVSASEILIVGHQPLLGELGRSWTGHRVSPVRAGVACIERLGLPQASENGQFNEVMARCLWMIAPQLSLAE